MTGFAAALVLLLAVPLAIASQALGKDVPAIIIHLALGTGCVLLAKAMFDFPVSHRMTRVGAASAVALGGVFLCQGLSLMVVNEELRSAAFDLLGQHVERFLTDAIIVWLLTLLLVAGSGWTRILGWIAMSAVVVAEVAAVAGTLLNADVPNLKVLLVLPIVWFLLESARGRDTPATADDHGQAELVAFGAG